MSLSKACEVVIDDMIDNHMKIQELKEVPEKNKKAFSDHLFQQQLLNKSAWEKFQDWANSWILHGYLLNTAQIGANIFSAAANAALTPLVREAGTIVAKLTGQKTDRVLGEGMAMYKAVFKNFEDRLKVGKEAFVTGRSKNDKLLGEMIGMDEAKFKQWIADNSVGNVDERFLRETLADIYGSHSLPGTFGRAYSVGARAGIAVDEFNQLMFKQMEFDALAFRAAENVAKRENISEEAAFKQLSESVNVASDQYPTQIRTALARMGYTSPEKALSLMESMAAENVFRGAAGKTLQQVMQIRRDQPLLGALVMPFVKTPTIIVNEGLAWVPIAGLLHRKAKFNAETGKIEGTDFAIRIPERKADFLAKQMMGTAALVMLGDYVDRGLITGSETEGGAPKYSMKIGDTWYSYSRVEPFATLLGLGVDIHRIAKKAKQDPALYDSSIGSLEKYGAMFISSFVQNVANKSFFQGLANIVGVLEAPERNAAAFFQSFANFIVPSGVAQVAKVVDPQEREFTTFMDRVQRRIPVLSKDLPARYDETGQPVQASLFEVLSGIKTKTPNAVAASLENYGFDLKPTGKKLYGVDMTTEQLSMVRKLAGNYFVNQVEALYKHPKWAGLDDSMKEFQLRQALSAARSAANAEVAGYMYVNDPEFRKAYNNNKLIQQGMRDDLLRAQGRLE